MPDNKTFQDAVDLINNATSVLLTTHIRPDGDACGCVRALMEIVQQLGKKAQPLFMSPLAAWYESLFDEKPSILGNNVQPEKLSEIYRDVDLVIIVDTDSNVQLPGLADWLAECGKKILVIDHHITGDDLVIWSNMQTGTLPNALPNPSSSHCPPIPAGSSLAIPTAVFFTPLPNSSTPALGPM
jgi:nanoRNase/pAp phosphatase (c-di-AMP/oligoRNAs hydrolase)